MKVFIFGFLTSVSLVLSSQFSVENKKFFDDYWQQDVKYTIKAKVDESKLTVG